MNNLKLTAALKLQKYIEDHCIKKTTFAKQMNITASHLQHVMKGACAPGLKVAYEIEKRTCGYVKIYDWIQDDWKKETEERLSKSLSYEKYDIE